jgi:hypothetical protein
VKGAKGEWGEGLKKICNQPIFYRNGLDLSSQNMYNYYRGWGSEEGSEILRLPAVKLPAE